jgi:hypothetical protein
MAETMKTLIDGLKAMFEAGITNGRIRSATVFKGLREQIDLIPDTQFPYIAIDDGGERVEDAGSNKAQNHFYTVMLEFGVKDLSIELAINDILDFVEECKDELELEANRKLDSHKWGINIGTFNWEKDMQFYRGRVVQVDFLELEDRYDDY